MPPKKAPAKDQKPPTSAGKAPSTASTLPGHPVKFKFNFETKHEGAQQYELKLFWLNPSNSSFEVSSLGTLREWTLKPGKCASDKQDESKKPKESAEQAVPPPPAPPAKGAAGKKGAAAPPPKKGAAAPPQDDLDENEPRTMLFEKELDPINVTQQLAMTISRVNLKLQIFKPGESGPTLVQTIEFDLSQFLFPKASKIEAYYKKFEEQKQQGSDETAPLPKELQIQQ